MNGASFGCLRIVFLTLCALAPPTLSSCEGGRLPPAVERTGAALLPVLEAFGDVAVRVYATAAVRKHAPAAFAVLDTNADGVLELAELVGGDLAGKAMAVALAAAVQEAAAAAEPAPATSPASSPPDK